MKSTFDGLGKTLLFILIIFLLLKDYKNNEIITVPNHYYEASVLHKENKNSLSSVTHDDTLLPIRDISYLAKHWLESNPEIPCSESDFLRAKERGECEIYKLQRDNYTWNVRTELNGKYYMYDEKTKTTYSCPDGYFVSYTMNKLTCEFETLKTILPKGCASSVGYSSVTGVPCNVYESK